MQHAHSDALFMQRALELAALGAGKVAPNPLVGCVVVHQGQIIGEGYHQQYGGSHAEVNALHSVENQDLLAESTVYVTLEPCDHYGKTPPCSLLLVNKQVKRVVVGTIDPFAAVAGKGIARLQAAGIEVESGLLESACRWQNRRFFTQIEKKRPYIILKWAQSADGFMAPAEAGTYWISSPESKLLVHQWRAEEAAILVGAKTLINDNPALTTRLVPGSNPLRVVLHHGALAGDYEALRDAAGHVTIAYEKEKLAECIPNILHELHARNVQSILVEGGASTLQAFLQSGYFDEIRQFVSKSALQAGLAAPAIPAGVALHSVDASGSDSLFWYTHKSAL